MKSGKLLLHILIFLLPTIMLLGQGSLAPPGAPAPTMKTLGQIEPRVDVATLAGDTEFHHIITASGSYYLSGNLNVTKISGIHIDAGNVTLDLNGFTIQQTGSGGFGIYSHGLWNTNNLHIKNGSVQGFQYGIGVDARNGKLTNVDFYDNTSVGFDSGFTNSWQIFNCHARGNNVGISAGFNSILKNCTSTNNTIHGFSIRNGSIITDCQAVNNGGDGFSFSNDAGLGGVPGARIQNCIADNNNVGIRLDYGSVVSCSVAVRGNSCNGNATYGILMSLFDSEISGNRVSGNNVGIKVGDTGSGSFNRNLVFGNISLQNTTHNYVINGQNKVAPIVTPPDTATFSGMTGGAGLGTTDPWANLSY